MFEVEGCGEVWPVKFKDSTVRDEQASNEQYTLEFRDTLRRNLRQHTTVPDRKKNVLLIMVKMKP